MKTTVITIAIIIIEFVKSTQCHKFAILFCKFCNVLEAVPIVNSKRHQSSQTLMFVSGGYTFNFFNSLTAEIKTLVPTYN